MIKQKFILLLSSIILMGFFANSSYGQDDPTVYVTRTGAKYHRVTCSYLRQSSIPMKLSEAVVYYTPCSRCHPPIPSEKASEQVIEKDKKTKETKAVKSVQCAGITKKGTRCKRMTSDPSGFCYQHISQTASTASKTKKDTTITKVSTKSSERVIYTGPRGGQYYYNDKGKKVYLKKK